jgi:hypothetical protein
MILSPLISPLSSFPKLNFLLLKIYISKVSLRLNMSLEEEKLITKIQIEFAIGQDTSVSQSPSNWDVGLLYLTTNNLWFVNRSKQRNQVSFQQILSVSEVNSRAGIPATKFSKVLGANYLLTLKYHLGDETAGSVLNVFMAAPADVLSALRSHLVVRTDKAEAKTVGILKLPKSELMKRLSVLLSLDIKAEEQLKFFLGLEQSEFVNLLIERSHLMQPVL